ncbi:MAG: flagellar brake protein [Colwellia sp.]|nr:flagellar brake protein [Colwellia sp.]MCW8863620.1 flagellar brake protein [Colwellia sp.]MCW9080412.1 flagellar brake protein [Colwellia sp.]
MTEKPTEMDTATRLSRNLGLLQAGATVTIDISTPAGQKAKFRTTFIGYLPKLYVLIQFPDSNKLGQFSQHLKQGTAITVRGLIEGHEGAVVAFVSTIKQTIQLPSRIMVLDFPQSVGLQNLRSAMRIDTNINAKVKIDETYWETTITDLSINGCQLSIVNGEKLVLSENKSIEITVEDKQGANNIKLKGEVCNLKQQTNGLSFGVKFSEQSNKSVSQLLLDTITSQD